MMSLLDKIIEAREKAPQGKWQRMDGAIGVQEKPNRMYLNPCVAEMLTTERPKVESVAGFDFICLAANHTADIAHALKAAIKFIDMSEADGEGYQAAYWEYRKALERLSE